MKKVTIEIIGEIGWWISADDIIRQLNGLKEGDVVTVLIHSDGGDVFEGAAIYNLIKLSPATFNAIIIGTCASMATVIASACDTVKMSNTATYMIHSPSGSGRHNKASAAELIKTLETIESGMIDSYVVKTGKTKEEIEQKYFDGADHYLTAEEARSEGFIDEVIDYSQDYENVEMFNKQKIMAFLNRDDIKSKFFENPKTTETVSEEEIKQMKAEMKRLKEQDAARREELETAKLAALEAQATSLVGVHVARGVITANLSSIYIIAAKTDFEGTKTKLEALNPVSPVPNPGTPNVQGRALNNFLETPETKDNPFSGQSQDNREHWTYEMWSEKDVAGLQALQTSNPEKVLALAKDFSARMKFGKGE